MKIITINWQVDGISVVAWRRCNILEHALSFVYVVHRSSLAESIECERYFSELQDSKLLYSNAKYSPAGCVLGNEQARVRSPMVLLRI